MSEDQGKQLDSFLQAIRGDISKVFDKLNSLEVLLVGQYIKKEEAEKRIEEVKQFTKTEIDEIKQELDSHKHADNERLLEEKRTRLKMITIWLTAGALAWAIFDKLAQVISKLMQAGVV